MVTDLAMNIPVLAGLVMGFIHVIQGPDHLAAVTPIAINSKNKAYLIGISWGIGHTFGALFIGVLFILFRQLLPVEKISHSSEVIVGILLIVIGIWGYLKATRAEKKEHYHKSHRQNIVSALSFGLFHGIAGISHIIAILPTLAFKSTSASVTYLTGFAVGTIVSMLFYSLIIGRISLKSEKLSNNKFSVSKLVQFGGASFAIIVGIIWLSISL